MVDYDTAFNVSGKFPTEDNFWETHTDDFIAGEGITEGFSTMIAEQSFRPLQSPRTPFYNTFAGRPLDAGEAWQTNAIFKNPARHFKPKATAQDALGFYDSKGMTVVHKLDVAGWRPVTLPDSLSSVTQFLSRNSVGQLNSMLVDNQTMGYQEDMESAIGKKAISTTKAEIEVTADDYIPMLQQINELAIKMRSDNNHYNDLTEEQNKEIITRSDDIVCFIDALTLVRIRESFSSLPSPDRLSDQATFIPVYSGMPTPITTAEFNESKEDASGTVINWNADPKPVAIDKEQPIAWIASRQRVEYRPLIGSYFTGLQRNEAGRFANQHMTWRGGIGINPFENAVRINAAE